MKLAKLKRKTLRQARRELRYGRMTNKQMEIVEAVVNDKARLAKLNWQIESEINPWKRSDGLVGADWKTWLANVWDWFVENWPAILKLIMTIAPLFLLDEHENTKSVERKRTV